MNKVRHNIMEAEPPRGHGANEAARARLRAVPAAAAMLALLLLLQGPASAATYTVGASGQDFSTIQAAIDSGAVVDYDNISVVDPVHTEQGIVVSKNLTIAGQGAADTIVQANAVENTATDRVFTIDTDQVVSIRNMTIRHGKATGAPARGGGILNLGVLTLSNAAVTANRVVGDGGAVAQRAYGAGIYNRGIIVINESSISANAGQGGTATAGPGQNAYGGGIYSYYEKTLTMKACAITGNTLIGADATGADNDGGAAYGGGVCQNNGPSGTLDIINCTISGNSVTGGVNTGTGLPGIGLGGGVSAGNGTTLTNCTIASNSASFSGGGMWSFNSTDNQGPFLGNTIFGDNTSGYSGPDIRNTVQSRGYNLIEDMSGTTLDTDGNGNTDTGNITGVDPDLGPLADNGGPTQTHALNRGSPAIDQIPADSGSIGMSPLHRDQRRVPRPDGAYGDIGAYEFEHKILNALEFDGTDDYLLVRDAGSGADLDFQASGFTFELWMYATKTDATPIAKGTGGTGNEYAFYVDGNGFVKFLGFNTADEEQNSGLSTTDVRDAWHHVAGVYTGTEFEIYVDGARENHQASSGTMKTNIGDLYMGAQPTLGQFHRGMMDEARIWNAALNDTQIRQMMNREVHGGGFAAGLMPSSLAGYWRFNQTEGAAAPDLSENYNYAALKGATGMATAGSATTLTDSTASWTNDALAGNTLRITDGTGIGQERLIASNTATVITVSEVWDTIPAADSEYALLPTWVVSGAILGGPGNGLEFDGTDDYVDIPYTAELGIGDEITIEASICPRTTSAGPMAIVAHRPAGSGATDHVFIVYDDQIRYLCYAGSWHTFMQAGLEANTWSHVAVSVTSSREVSLYIDGVRHDAGSYSGTLTQTTHDWYIGKDTEVSDWFEGLIDEVRIWNVARSEAQIFQRMYAELDGGESGLAAYYRFDRADGVTVPDLGPGAITGTLMNGPTNTPAADGLANGPIWSRSYSYAKWIGTGAPSGTADWHVDTNWLTGVVPMNTNYGGVVIPNLEPNPEIAAPATCANLALSTGAELAFTGGNALTVYGGMYAQNGRRAAIGASLRLYSNVEVNP